MEPVPAISRITPDLVLRMVSGFAASGVGMALLTPEDTIAYASPVFAELWDIQPGARNFSDILRHCHEAGTGPVIATDDFDAWLANANSKRRSMAERAFEVDMHDGRWFWTTEAIFDGGWLLLTISEITQLKAHERTLRQARDAAMYWAETDALTGLHNRHFVMRRLVELCQDAQVAGTALCVALLDIDYFKSVNDVHGHDVGDKVLQHFATIGRMAVRKNDLLARVGGEEFLLILPEVELDAAFGVVDRLRQQIAEAWPVGPGVLSYTVSGGVVQLRAEETAEQIYKRADQTLYRAKTTGRNRIERH